MSAKLLCTALAGAAILFIAPSAQADRLVLKNGDVLTGTVLHKSGDSLSFSTPYAGVVSVNWAAVRTLTTDRPVNVYLDDATDYDAKFGAAGDGRATVTLKEPAQHVDTDPDAPPSPPAYFRDGGGDPWTRRSGTFSWSSC